MLLINQNNPAEGFDKQRVFVVDDAHWADQQYRDSILKNMKDQWKGFEPEYYATVDTYKEDAGYCFSRHKRPTEGCIDWQDDSKRLTPSDWKLSPVYLCHFCPVSAYYSMRSRDEKGMYN